jgi:outer membrane protein assembly factor BamB
MLRSRDIVALLMAVWLMRLAWNDENENSHSAAFHLAFYTHAKVFEPLDIDGDGTTEALAIVEHNAAQQKWDLEILDLKPIHQKVLTNLPPFRPKSMFPPITIETLAAPITMATGQIMVQPKVTSKKVITTTATSGIDYTDRSRHYFCGTDWHDASQKCGTPCPGGTPGECPGDEKCFADTPCDALATASSAEGETDYQLTPAGGLPAIVTLWSDGAVRMHAVTTSPGSTGLQVRELWSQNLVLGMDVYQVTLLGDVDVSEGNQDLGRHGMVVIGGTAHQASLVYALDTMTGQLVWTSSSQKDELPQAEPIARGTTSVARRRSRLLEEAGESLKDWSLPNCWTLYKHSLLHEGIPHSFWGPADSKWDAIHVNCQKIKPQPKHKKWHHKHRQRPIQGRPNVLLGRFPGGLHLRSLKNGRSICHLSLMDHIFYADLNHDGTLDQVQAVTSSTTMSKHDEESNGKWVAALAHQVARDIKSNRRESGEVTKRVPSKSLCHVLALSGIPAREQLFAANLCPGSWGKEQVELSAAPPLLMPHDQLVVALSNGLVSKYQAKTGIRVWQHFPHEDHPTWSHTSDAAMTASIYPKQANSPILVSGENGMTILSNARGNVLASTVFPQQPTTTRPVLQDWSGDGTVDVLIATPDAVWGYVVVVKRGASVFFRILVGFLFVGMALALLRNRHISGSGDKRSTDK